jgi:mono/diheme cytochrome c family protein
MNKLSKTLCWIAGGALTVAAGAVGTGYLIGNYKRDRVVELPKPVEELDLARGRVEHGAYLYRTRGCVDCHGAAGAGRVAADSGGLLIVAPNITGGLNSAVREYAVSDWVRTLRHGVKPSGRPVLFMPSEDYNRLSDADMASLVLYVKQLPAVPGKAAMVHFPLPVQLMYGFGLIRDAAQKIDHDLPPPTPVAAAVSLQHGAYVANACIGCHGAHLGGGKVPGGPPDWPAAANLTPGEGSVLPTYPTAESFSHMLRTGVRPDGSKVNPAMPFESLREMNDTDVHALYAFLKTTPPRAFGSR